MDTAQHVYETARRYLPGGVTASARMNRAIGHPFYVSRGDGAYVYDLQGRQFVDMCLSHGASLLGHNPYGAKIPSNHKTNRILCLTSQLTQMD